MTVPSQENPRHDSRVPHSGFPKSSKAQARAAAVCLLAACSAPAQTITPIASFNGANGSDAYGLTVNAAGNLYGTNT